MDETRAAGRGLRILGTRGIPAKHGGFETFAEHLACYLVGRGWRVTVYCQEDGNGPVVTDEWNGVARVRIPVPQAGPLGTIAFDWKSTRHAARHNDLVLTLGYNTAAFCALYRLYGRRNLINMDGIEWKREKWRPAERVWLYLNERLGCWLGNHLIADHPEIKKHLASRVRESKITVIPYGANEVRETAPGLLQPLGLAPNGFAVVIARPEPENQILEIVRAFSRRTRGVKLVLLGDYDARESAYHRAVVDAASEEVVFPGAIYDKPVVEAVRSASRLYIHGHTVGGTNPSLVEALGAGAPVLAHDNVFNRWVVGNGGVFFQGEDDCAAALDRLLQDPLILDTMREASRARFGEKFTWPHVLGQYETLLQGWSDEQAVEKPDPHGDL